MDDADSVQRIRKHAWRARYLHPASGVTPQVLEEELAVLPPTEADLAYFQSMLAKPCNAGRNLVAVRDGQVIGALTYDRASKNEPGCVGVFVAAGLDRMGVGDALLSALLASTSESLEVFIFARNPSWSFYRRHGFVQEGSEFEESFREGVSLPVQRLVLER
jgi:predicted N-acetyltransferase YhbS